nr:ABC transporter permease [Anaerolineae bacterium]
MMSSIGNYMSGIWTIASKDIVDSIKNKVTLSIMVIVLFATMIYRMVPGLEAPQLLVYDEGQSIWVSEMATDSELELNPMPSWQDVETFLSNRDIVAIGIRLPADFDEQVDKNSTIELEGYIAHWVSESAASEMQMLFERQLSDLMGKPVRINTTGNLVYTEKDSRGFAQITASGLVFLLMMIGIGIVPQLMNEERRTRTMDALLVFPISAGQIVLGKALAGFFYCLVGAGIVLALNGGLITHWSIALLATLSGALFTVSLGLMLGSIADSRQVMSSSWMLLLFLMMPVTMESMLKDLLPASLNRLVGFLPTTALTNLYRVSFAQSVRLADFALELAILSACTILVLVIAAGIVKRSDR